jgi:RimJ/RimL family protein N-acetyltransferase
MRTAWGRGYATEAASAAMEHAFAHCDLQEIITYTSADNVRSQAVMERLKLRRDSSRDFVADYGKGEWRGLVWVARA